MATTDQEEEDEGGGVEASDVDQRRDAPHAASQGRIKDFSFRTSFENISLH